MPSGIIKQPWRDVFFLCPQQEGQKGKESNNNDGWKAFLIKALVSVLFWFAVLWSFLPIIGSIANKTEVAQELFPHSFLPFWFTEPHSSSPSSVVSQNYVFTTLKAISRFSQGLKHLEAYCLLESYTTECNRKEDNPSRRHIFCFKNSMTGPPTVLTDYYSAKILLLNIMILNGPDEI